MIDSSGQIAYDYDMNSRLIEAGAANYSYDWVGNRLVPGSAQYNAADQLTSGFGHTYNYDGRGNLTSSVGQDGKTYIYTPANLLESVTHDEVQGIPTSSMTWDADSNRVSFSSSEGGTWQFVYDVTAGIPAVIEEVTPSGSVYYLREPNGALIARISGSDISYYHFDALGSTRLLTDGLGTVTDEYSYDAWGNVSHDTGSTAQPYQFVGQLGYYTHWQDPNLDLLQLGVRFYDPEAGRFTQRDPIRDGLNWYAYVNDNPVSYTDSKGLMVDQVVSFVDACCTLRRCTDRRKGINICCNNPGWKGQRWELTPLPPGKSRLFGVTFQGECACCYRPSDRQVDDWLKQNPKRGLKDAPEDMMCVIVDGRLVCAPCSNPGWFGELSIPSRCR